MTLEGAQSRIWCYKIGWPTVPCSWSIDGKAALTGSSSPGYIVPCENQKFVKDINFRQEVKIRCLGYYLRELESCDKMIVMKMND